MGRRKIEIQPILHDRNRSVTFLKRKNGLFKKAYELGVLCSVDVVVIVFGHNQKLYEYSSTPSATTAKIIEKRLNYTGEKESRGPHDFGSDKVDADGDADGLGDDDSDDQLLSPPSAGPGGAQQLPSSTKASSSAKLRQSPTHRSRDNDFIDESPSNGGPSGSSISRDRPPSQSRYQQHQQQPQQQQQQHQHQHQHQHQQQQHDNSTIFPGAGGPPLSLAHLLAGGGSANLNIHPSAAPGPYDLPHFPHPQFSDPLSASQSLAHLLTANPYLASQLSSLSYHSHLNYPTAGPTPFPMHPFGPPGGPGSAGPGSVPAPGAPHMSGVNLPGIGGYPLHPLYSSPLFATLLAQQQQQQHQQHQQNSNAFFPLHSPMPHPSMPREHSHNVDRDGRSPRPVSTDWSAHQQQQHHGYNRPIKRESSLDRSDNRGGSRQSGGDNRSGSVGGVGAPRSSRSPSPSSHSRGDYAAGTNPGSGTGLGSSPQKSGATWLDFLNAISSQPAASMATHPSSVATGLPGIGIGLPGINSFPPFGSPLNPGAMDVGNIGTGGIGAIGALGAGSLGAESPHPGIVGYSDMDSASGAAFSATATSGYDSPRAHKRRHDLLDDSNTTTGGNANLAGGSSALASPPSSSPGMSRERHTEDSSASLADVEFDFSGGMDGEDDKKLDPDYVENAMGRRAPAKRTRVT